MFQLGQLVLGLAQLPKALLSLNMLLVVALLGAVAHTAPITADTGAHVDADNHFVFQSSYTVLTDSLDDDSKKPTYEIRPLIPSFLYKFHFLFALLMFFFVALIVISDSVAARALLLLPLAISYSISHVLFACDQAEMLEGMMERYKRRICKPQM